MAVAAVLPSSAAVVSSFTPTLIATRKTVVTTRKAADQVRRVLGPKPRERFLRRWPELYRLTEDGPEAISADENALFLAPRLLRALTTDAPPAGAPLRSMAERERIRPQERAGERATTVGLALLTVEGRVSDWR